jgi:hypothetical protein
MDQILLKIGKAIKDYYNQVSSLGKTEEEFNMDRELRGAIEKHFLK